MPWHRQSRPSIWSLTIGLLLIARSTAAAQGNLDRGLTNHRTEGPEAAPSPPTINALGPESVMLKGKLLIQPLGSVSHDDNDVGLSVAYQNTNRYTKIPWQLGIRGLRRYRDGVGHAGWQANAEVDPSLPSIRRHPLLAALTAAHGSTADLGRFDELAAEIDFAILADATLTVGVVGYYDWSGPVDAETTHGGTFGLIGYWERGKWSVGPEYDFSSDFAGEDSYSVSGSYLLVTTKRSKTQIRLRGGWQKGGTFSLRLQFAVPHEKPSALM